LESTLADSSHTIGNSDASKSTATIECIVADANHAIANGDAGKITASRVFASLFLSAIYILNGRKVVTWIL
jgi:hypothetical protein